VVATIVSVAPDRNRLVLTSDTPGAGGIQLVNEDSATARPLEALGLQDGTVAANRTGDGRTQTFRLTSNTAALTTFLGVSPPPANTSIVVGGKRITVDFAHDSLTTVAQQINAAGGFAEVREETVGSAKGYRLVVGGNVAADAAPSSGTPADSQRALELLGLVKGGRAAATQTVSSGVALQAAGGNATAATLLSDLTSGGAGAGVQAGDTFTFRGSRGDGTAVDLTYTVQGPGDTLGDVVSFLNNSTNGFGAGTRTATASVVDGRIVLTDGTSGESRLALSMTANNEGGGSLAFGASATTGGFAREVTRGGDARIRVDGVLVTRSSNSVSDAIAGVTLNLQEAQPGTLGTLTVDRDVDATVSAFRSVATEYNNVLKLAQQQTSASGALAASGALRGALASIKSALLTDVVGLSSGNPYVRGAVAGVSLTKTGTLEVDDAALRKALQADPANVKAAFSSAGSTTSAQISYVLSGDATQPGSYAVQVTSLATKAGHTGSGLAGAYSGAHDLTVTDALSGKTATLALSGKTVTDIVGGLNTAFAASSMKLTAVDDGGQLRIEGTEYGSAASYTLTGSFDEAQLGFTKSTAYAGTDVQGTLGGKAATGKGQTLTGGTGTPAAGLAVRYTGAATGAAGSVSFVLGIGGMLGRATDSIVRTGSGVAATQSDSISVSVESLNRRIDTIQQTLDVRRKAMTKQFTAMESAMSKIQSQTSWLTSQIAALPSYSNS
ncbi:MAG: flagellar filament capping protein FliD, partial [Gemmatimonadetes bacterium]|nr:flagellar filament capping protein FliD [Gemmatimonadota bacterium]